MFDGVLVHWVLAIIGAIVVVIVGQQKISDKRSILLAIVLFCFGVWYSMALGSSFTSTISMIDVGGSTRYMVAAYILLLAVLIRAVINVFSGRNKKKLGSE